jgi:hypothetical protein
MEDAQQKSVTSIEACTHKAGPCPVVDTDLKERRIQMIKSGLEHQISFVLINR